MSNPTTRIPEVAVGGKPTKGLAAAIIAGSIILGGAIYFDRGQVSKVEQLYGTGSYLTYDDVPFTRSGSTNYWRASWVNPYPVAFDVDKITTECDDAGINKLIPVDAGTRTSSQTNSSGSNVWNSRQMGTGSVLKHSTGSHLLAVGSSIRATTASGSYPTSTRCVLRVWGNPAYDA